jgi:molybdate transport system substrate-binding protein
MKIAMPRRTSIAAALVGALTGIVMSTAVNATEIHFVASTAMREALEALVPLFERASGHKVLINFQSGADLPVRVKEGVAADLVMTTPDNIATLVAAAKVIGDSQVYFVRSYVGVAVRSGAPKPDISTVEGFKNALLAARKVGISKGPSGQHLMMVLQKLGIADQVWAKAVVPALGVRVGTLVANGEADIGVQQITELLPIPGIEFVGSLPRGLQTEIAYVIVRATATKEPAAADALVKFLKSETAAPILKKMGLDPV